MSTKTEVDSIWVGVEQDYDSERTELFKERERAMEWLVRQWQNARRDMARTHEYWVRDYTEKAMATDDPGQRDYYGGKADDPDLPEMTDIKESLDGDFAEFNSGHARFFIQKRGLR